MIFGLGVDIIEVERVKKKLEAPLFKSRVFSQKEIDYCEKFHNKEEHYAGRFAAKEAFLKALGDGWSGAFAFSDIEIINDKKGKPEISLLNQASVILEENKWTKIHVSIAHLKEMATATVILEIE